MKAWTSRALSLSAAVMTIKFLAESLANHSSLSLSLSVSLFLFAFVGKSGLSRSGGHFTAKRRVKWNALEVRLLGRPAGRQAGMRDEWV